MNRYYLERRLSIVAISNKNASICIPSGDENSGDESWIEMQCIQKVAQALSDSAICNMLER